MSKRRDFIKKSLLAGAGLAVTRAGFSAKSYRSIMGANDRINIAVIGISGRGSDHISNFCSLKDSHNVRINTLCDVDEKFWAEGSKVVMTKSAVNPKMEWDMKKVFDDKDIHAVTFATPNHWHALGTIWACQAGKHVYVEKPACHNIFEGRKMIEAAARYNVRVQTGFQNRSIPNVREAIKFLHDGGIGDVFMARGLCIKPRDSFGISKDSEPPATLHYDRWLGPAPQRPYNEKRGHYNWHWHWDTGNGDTGNQGPHQFDVARWGLNKHEHPVSVFSSGGIYGISPEECSQETPNTQMSIAKYKDGKILEFETRGRYSNAESSSNIRVGNVFFGTEGYLELDGSKWKAFRKRETEPFAGSKKADANQVADPTFRMASGGAAHYINFLDAIRSGQDSTLNCHIKEGFYSSAVPLLANISYRLNRQVTFVGDKENFLNDKDADAMLSRAYRKPYVVLATV